MGINEIIMYIMMFFMLIAAVDRILSQFGGSARFLGKFGKSIEGSGGQFEEGFMAMGALGLAMVGFVGTLAWARWIDQYAAREEESP